MRWRLALALLLAAVASADSPVQTCVAGVLRWGGDQAGGGPYIFEGPDGRLTGFEAELAEHLAAAMGLKAEFVQGEWGRLPQLVERGDIDLVLNGYEWTPEREASWASSVPYYVYTLQLMARHDDASVRDWEDLRGRRIGVLGGSAAERLVRERLGASATVLCFDGVTNAMRQVEQGQLDATVQDLPIAAYYGPQFPGLRSVGQPVAPGWYVAFLSRGNPELKAAVDAALRKAVRDGTLRRIYMKYGIWNDAQEGLEAAAASWPPAATSRHPPFSRWGWLLASAAWTTVKLSALAMPLAMVLGLVIALGRLYGPRWLSMVLALYVELLRGTPVLLQLFVIYYLLPAAGIRIDAFWAGVLGLGINYSAYEAENYRAGLLAVPKGQWEAALALGMDRKTALLRVVVPQAVRIVIPPVTNDFIALFKDTSVCSVIAVTELTGMYNRLYNNHPGMVLKLAAMTAVLYLLMSYPLSLLARRLEARR